MQNASFLPNTFTINSNMIERIRLGLDGYRLISFCRVINFKKVRPFYGPTRFADYKNGTLRIFNRSAYTTIQVDDFKSAIIYLRKFTDF